MLAWGALWFVLLFVSGAGYLIAVGHCIYLIIVASDTDPSAPSAGAVAAPASAESGGSNPYA